MSHDKKTCFVIAPIGPKGSAIRRAANGLIDAAIDVIQGTEGVSIRPSKT